MTGRASTSSSFQYHFTYDVFLNFRGKDTRPGFTGSLYHALDQKGIHTFFDDEEIRKGDEIAPRLDRAIEESRMAICVFSKDYASSTFCLNELVKIHQSIKKNGRLVWPIFYDVEPAEVRHQKGNYGQALSVHKQDLRADEEKLQSWKLALREVANLSGTHVTPGHDYEYKTIERIVKEIFCKINRGPLHVAEYPVGLDIRFQKVNSLLQIGSHDEVIMVGIYGIGGSGKTTLARIVYNSIADNFEGLCFLHDIKEEKLGLERMQERMLSKILGVDIKIDYANEGVTVIKERLRQKRILLILDNVDKLEQLQKIAGHGSWFGSGSRIIITTRDKHLLKRHRVERKYEMEALSNKESLQLLSWNAFQSAQVDPSYNEVVDRVIHYAHGLPLALEVIGSHLFGMSIEDWQSAINMYERIPQDDIQRILKVSYDGLTEVEKDIFLDIACFYKGDPWKQVKDMVEYAHGFDPHYGIQVLVNKCLIKNNASGHIDIHDLIQDMGREIVRQESPKEPGKRSRLWSHEDIMHVLKENTGTNNVRIIASENVSQYTEVSWDGRALEKMKNLKILSLKNLKFSEGPKYLPDSLKVLEWGEYPSSSLPHNFHARELFVMNVPHSRLKSVKFKTALNLSVLNLKGCQNITQIPDLSGISNLKELNLLGCMNLIAIDDSVGELERLESLDVSNCAKLKTFPRCIKSLYLEFLELGGCSSLKYFPEILSKALLTVCMRGSGIEKLPACIKECTSLEQLWLEECEHLQEVEGIPPNLELLDASDCISLSLESRNLLLSKEVIGAGISKDGDSFVKKFVMSGSSIPEWMDVCKKGGSISFWFRYSFPPLCFCALLNPSSYLHSFYHMISLNGMPLHPYIHSTMFSNNSRSKEDYVLLYVPEGDPLDARRRVLKDGVWNYVQISVWGGYYPYWPGIKESGIYMIREHCNMEDIRFTIPLNLDSLNIDQEFMEDFAKNLETEYNLSTSSFRDWVECMKEESIPEWFHKRTKGQSVSFWFRNKFPTLCGGVLLNLDCDLSDEFLVFIGGELRRHYHILKIGNTAFYGMNKFSFYNAHGREQAIQEGQWNYVNIYVADAKESGIYVTEQQYNKEDIRFTDPYVDAMAGNQGYTWINTIAQRLSQRITDTEEEGRSQFGASLEENRPMLNQKRPLMEGDNFASTSTHFRCSERRRNSLTNQEENSANVIEINVANATETIGIQEQEPPVSSKKDLPGNLLQPQEIEYENRTQTIDIQSPSRTNEESIQMMRQNYMYHSNSKSSMTWDPMKCEYEGTRHTNNTKEPCDQRRDHPWWMRLWCFNLFTSVASLCSPS